MKKITVLHFGGDSIRGSEICLFLTLEALLEDGYEVSLLRNNPVMDKKLPLDATQQLKIINFHYPEIMIDGKQTTLPFVKYSQSACQLLKHVRTFKPNVLLCNSGLPCQTAVPVAKITNTPVVCHFHHPAPKRYFYLWLVRFVSRLVFPSQYTQTIVKEKCGRTGTVVYNAVDLENTFFPVETPDPTLRKELNISADSLVFGQVGALVPHKRPDMLIDAFAVLQKSHPNTHLVLVGEGPMRQHLEHKINILELRSSTTITGYVDSVTPYYQQLFDINMLVSREEGLGISVLEGAGCGLPAIVADCTGLAETVENGSTGLKFSPYNQEELLQHMQNLANNTERRREYGNNARKAALERFNIEQYKQGMLNAILSAQN